MMRGRPNKPVELKRRLGNPGKRPLPAQSSVITLAPVSPFAPETLGVAGREFYEAVLEEAPWVGATDRWMLEDVAMLTDVRAWLLDCDEPNTREIREVVALRWKGMAELGLSTSARSRLGVAEVKSMSKLEELRARRTGA